MVILPNALLLKRLALAVSIPVLGIGLPFAYAVVRDHGPLGWFRTLWVYVSFLLLAAAAFLPFLTWHRRQWIAVAAGTCVMVSFLLTTFTESEWTLAKRGLIDHCLVTEVTEEYVSTGTGYTTVYTSHLRCPHGSDTVKDTPRERGALLTVLWDPTHRIGTQSMNYWIPSETKIRIAAGTVVAGMLLVLLDVLIDLRRPSRKEGS